MYFLCLRRKQCDKFQLPIGEIVQLAMRICNPYKEDCLDRTALIVFLDMQYKMFMMKYSSYILCKGRK